MTQHASLLVDSHAHFHDCFSWGTFLDSASANLARARREVPVGAESPGCLILVESAGVHAFDALMDGRTPARSLGWEIDRTDEPCSLLLRRHGRAPIVMGAGRQIVTAERLEVLALGFRGNVPDGRPVREVVQEVTARGALAVVPWGFGKWLGARGRILRTLIEENDGSLLCLGDNGGRPRVARRPRLFAAAEERGVPVLAGSDPLPMPWQVRRVGSYGFVLDGWDQTARPLEAITARIRASRQSPPVFGELSSAASVVRAQIGVRWAL